MVWAAEFASNADALSVAPLIAKAARLSVKGSHWQGMLPQYAWGLQVMGDAPQTGTNELWVDGSYVLMASRTATI
jgi:hypothetical protein